MEMQKATTKKYLEGDGFGFVRPDAGAADIFSMSGCHPISFPKKARVYSTNDSKNGRPQAVNVQSMGWESVKSLCQNGQAGRRWPV
jgi:hypothetical protein